jgi:hypothetical protein
MYFPNSPCFLASASKNPKKKNSIASNIVNLPSIHSQMWYPYFFFVLLEFELRASHLLGKSSTT